MKILIISKTIYPHITPRAFRTTELAKELGKRGHNVIVYSVLGSTNYDEFKTKYNVEVKPINMLFSTIDSDGVQKISFINRVLIKLLGRIIEYPDVEFVWKVPQILKKEKNVDLLITIAVPHPIHWGAALAKKKCKNGFPKKWISDCGDPYMGNGFIKYPFYFKYIEKFWTHQTDFITIPIEEGRIGYLTEAQEKIRIIPQGFNFDDVKIFKYTRNDIPHFSYAGAIYIKYRDPSNFLEYLCTLNEDFVFTVYTNAPGFYQKYKDILGNKIKIEPYMKRENLIYELSKQDFLINLENKNASQSPSKLIDYVLTKRPIVSISSGFTKKEEINFANFMKGDYSSQLKNIQIEDYDIKNVVNKFLSI